MASGKAINANDGPDPTTSLTSTPRSETNVKSEFVNSDKNVNFDKKM